MRRLFLVLAGLGVAGVVVARLIGRWRSTWGVSAVEAVRILPGDELVAHPVAIETRGITIDAPAASVWPWLVQMGFGRGGWYSYDQLDMGAPSATGIVPDLQRLAVGDLLPTHPGGGFVVRSIEPERSLVVYSDTDLVRAQAEAAKAAGQAQMPANLQATNVMMAASQPVEFAASWAFVVEPLEDDRTRLVERLRVHFGEPDKPWMRYTLPIMGTGVFLMIRRQLLGIRERAERLARDEATRVTHEAASAERSPASEPVAVEPMAQEAGPA